MCCLRFNFHSSFTKQPTRKSRIQSFACLLSCIVCQDLVLRLLARPFVLSFSCSSVWRMRSSGFLVAAAAASVAQAYWMEDIAHHGIASFNPDSGYQVFRNVKDFGALGNGGALCMRPGLLLPIGSSSKLIAGERRTGSPR